MDNHALFAGSTAVYPRYFATFARFGPADNLGATG
jgi:hypothetical protein